MPKEVWLTTAEAAELEGISRQAALVKAQTGQWKTRIDSAPSRGGNAGKRYLAALSSLTNSAQQRWYTRCLTDQPRQTTKEPLSPASPAPVKQIKEKINPAEVHALVGNERFEKMMDAADRKAAAVKEFLAADKTGRSALAIQIAAKYGVSSPTIYRWAEEYQKGGTTALMQKPKSLGTGTVRYSISEETLQMIYAEYLQPNKPTPKHVYKKVCRWCELQTEKAPSQATLYRVIEDLNKTKPDLVCLAREGEEEYMKRYAVKANRQEPEFTNQYWEGDHHRMDVFICHDTRAVRPWITLWLDVTSRAVVGWAISIQANGRTIGLALRHGILEKHLPVWGKSFSPPMSKSLANQGWDQEMLKQTSGLASPISGMPATLYIDNGEDYKAKVKQGLKNPDWADYPRAVRSSCELLDINTMFCTKYSPWAKGHIERFFGTFTGQFSRYLPGYCGNDNGRNRPFNLDEQAMAARGELLNMDELRLLVEMYIHVYHNTVHSALGMTPLEKYQRTAKVREGLPDERALDICLMDAEKARVYSTGIQRFNHYYTHRLLEEYVGRTVVIRYDPNRVGELLIFNPKTGELVCTATNRELLGWGASKDDVSEFQRQRASRRKELKATVRGLKDNTLEATINKRQANGPVMVTGDHRAPEKGTYITGLEKAAQARAKTKPPTPTPAQASEKISRFDAMVIKAAQK